MGFNENVTRYVKEKGIDYFLNPSEEDLKLYEGLLFSDGRPNLSLLYYIMED